MPEALAIARDDYMAAELREAAAHSNDAGATRRILALALVLEGYKRGEAGKLCGMDRQTLRDGVLRYNAEGIAGLCNQIAAGPKPRLTPPQEAAVAELVHSQFGSSSSIKATGVRHKYTALIPAGGYQNWKAPKIRLFGFGHLNTPWTSRDSFGGGLAHCLRLVYM